MSLAAGKSHRRRPRCRSERESLLPGPRRWAPEDLRGFLAIQEDVAVADDRADGAPTAMTASRLAKPSPDGRPARGRTARALTAEDQAGPGRARRPRRYSTVDRAAELNKADAADASVLGSGTAAGATVTVPATLV